MEASSQQSVCGLSPEFEVREKSESLPMVYGQARPLAAVKDSIAETLKRMVPPAACHRGAWIVSPSAGAMDG
jgi:hypothetical protein